MYHLTLLIILPQFSLASTTFQGSTWVYPYEPSDEKAWTSSMTIGISVIGVCFVSTILGIIIMKINECIKKKRVQHDYLDYLNNV